MADTLTQDERSRVMAQVRNRDTVPELAVRRAAWSLGHRYRLQGKHLPGRPDLVMAGRRTVVFVHGCFWHRHQGCPRTRTPKSRQEFWLRKFSDNVTRDRRALRSLRRDGWRAVVIWECQTEDEVRLKARLQRVLGAHA